MAIVQEIRGDQKTFAEIADSLMYMVLNEGTDSQRIDVVFDVYRDNSIKNPKRTSPTTPRHIQDFHVTSARKIKLNNDFS